MAEQNFVDYVKICCRSGKGGAGSSHFLRDRFNSRGGPDGGDGGRGGHIILRGNRNTWTLLHLKYRKHVIAGDGKPGGGSTSTGGYGEDVILDVPLGTVAKDAETGEIHFEITEHEQKMILTPGGRGGLGNNHFKTSTNQAPEYAQPGEPGREEWKVLELKVLADVGLVGFPNAGKSTLINALAKRELAIVSPVAGTTRDVIETPLALDGIAMRFSDTAGLRGEADAIEAIGIDRAKAAVEAADILLWLGPPKEAPHHPRTILIAAQADRWRGDAAAEAEAARCDLILSAATGEGLDRLHHMIVEMARTLLPREGEAALLGHFTGERNTINHLAITQAHHLIQWRHGRYNRPRRNN